MTGPYAACFSRKRAYDLAVRIARTGSTSHVARRLASSRNVAAASPDYLKRKGTPEVPDDLARHVCVGYTYSATADEWPFVDAAGKPHPVTVDCAFHTNNGDTVRAAGLAGHGIIWAPTFLIGADLRDGRLVELLPGYRLPDIDVQALYPSRRHLSAKVRVMVDFLAEAFAGTPPWDRPAGPATVRRLGRAARGA